MNATSATRLQPLEVPWMISPSTPEMSLRMETGNGQNKCIVGLIAFFGEGTSTTKKWGKYRRIEICFEDVLYSRFFPKFSTEGQSRIDGYDWSAVPEFRDESGSLAGSVERIRTAWSETMVCPSPSSYWVANSDLIQTLGLKDSEFMHYLFLGDDFSVELIAKGLTWNTIGDELA